MKNTQLNTQYLQDDEKRNIHENKLQCNFDTHCSKFTFTYDFYDSVLPHLVTSLSQQVCCTCKKKTLFASEPLPLGLGSWATPFGVLMPSGAGKKLQPDETRCDVTKAHQSLFQVSRWRNQLEGKIMNQINFTPMRSLRDLQQCADVATLTPALHGLCSHFGRIEKLAILTAVHEGAQQAICFLRLDSPEKEQDLMKTLGVGRFGGEVVFVVDLKAQDGAEEFNTASQWRNFADTEPRIEPYSPAAMHPNLRSERPAPSAYI